MMIKKLALFALMLPLMALNVTGFADEETEQPVESQEDKKDTQWLNDFPFNLADNDESTEEQEELDTPQQPEFMLSENTEDDQTEEKPTEDSQG